MLTGATPAYGISAANAIKLATEEANRNGAICSRPDSIRRLGSYFANHFWAGSDDPLVKKFVADYRAKYGVDPDAGCRYCIRRGANAL